MNKVLVIHGPNLNLLGKREPELYGTWTLERIDEALVELGRELALSVTPFQSNGEAEIIERIQGAGDGFDAILINPAAYGHTSIAIRDALLAVGLPTVEVHLTNIARREEFRRRSLLADIVDGSIMGFGAQSYLLGLRAIHSIFRKSKS